MWVSILIISEEFEVVTTSLAQFGQLRLLQPGQNLLCLLTIRTNLGELLYPEVSSNENKVFM